MLLLNSNKTFRNNQTLTLYGRFMFLFTISNRILQISHKQRLRVEILLSNTSGTIFFANDSIENFP